MVWNTYLATQYARINAKPHSIGACAHYVSEAIRFGGVYIPNTPYARDMGNTLLTAGFQYTDGNLYIGDIAVIQPVPGHPYGHACIYDGNNWISDFIQQSMYPGPAYRTTRPPYAIFRHA